MNNSKIIAVVGAPRCGKSFLAQKLADFYKAELIPEEEKLPARIEEDISKNIRPMERIMWFRNQLIKKWFTALEFRKQGKNVIVDTYWISCQPYIDALADGFEKEILREMASLDREMLSRPDAVIFLTNSEEGIRKFIAQGGRAFDQSEDFIKNQALPINKLHIDFFSQFLNKNVIKIDRSNLDFEKEGDFKIVIDKITATSDKPIK